MNINKFTQYSFFIKPKHVKTSTELCKKSKNCKESKEAKVGVYMCLLKIRIIIIDYLKLMVNNRYNI